MNYRIIETASDFPDVLLYRDVDEHGNNTVNIHTSGIKDGEEDMFAIETISFPNTQSAKSFIRDYSYEAAIEFCERNDISYQD